MARSGRKLPGAGLLAAQEMGLTSEYWAALFDELSKDRAIHAIGPIGELHKYELADVVERYCIGMSAEHNSVPAKLADQELDRIYKSACELSEALTTDSWQLRKHKAQQKQQHLAEQAHAAGTPQPSPSLPLTLQEAEEENKEASRYSVARHHVERLVDGKLKTLNASQIIVAGSGQVRQLSVESTYFLISEIIFACKQAKSELECIGEGDFYSQYESWRDIFIPGIADLFVKMGHKPTARRDDVFHDDDGPDQSWLRKAAPFSAFAHAIQTRLPEPYCNPYDSDGGVDGPSSNYETAVNTALKAWRTTNSPRE